MERTMQRATYRRLLLSWASKVNLIGPEAKRNLDAHLAEALEAAELLQPEGEVLDFGSGGGLPAIPMAIEAAEGARFHLVEADARKWSFLKFVVRECELNCVIHGGRLDAVIPRLDPRLRFDLITSRAVGYPEQWLPIVVDRLSPRGRIALFQSSSAVPKVSGLALSEAFQLSRGERNFLVLLNRST